jgi:peptide/nickel transport system ATP-binding protein
MLLKAAMLAGKTGVQEPVTLSSPLLKVQDLRVWFGAGEDAVRAVDGVDLSIRHGETQVLLGESGCGKSMTALAVMRLLPPGGQVVSGRVGLDGQDLLKLPELRMREVRGGRIAMIFQEPQTSLNPVQTVGEQIGEALARHKGLSGAARRTRVLELLDAVGIPDRARRYGEYPHQLSGGMKQRIMIAMALAGEPELLIADEPTTALDVTIQAQVLELLRQLQRDTGMAILLITHDLGIVGDMADQVAVMYAGHIVEQASRDTFFARPAHPYSRKLFESVPSSAKRGQRLSTIRGGVPSLNQVFPACRFEPRCDHAWKTCKELAPRWIESAAGQGVRCHLYDPEIQQGMHCSPLALALSIRGGGTSTSVNQNLTSPPSAGAAGGEGVKHQDPLLNVTDLKVHFPIVKGVFRRVVGHVKAVDGITLRIDPGKTLALVGESGCGKTTAGKGILRLIPPSGGGIHFNGEDFARLSAGDLRRRRGQIQFIFQDPHASMNPRMRIADILEEGMTAQRVGKNRAERQSRVDELLHQVGLSPEVKSRYPHEFSGGQRQRICIARALAVDPKLIICDEPTSALDVSVQAQILNLLKDLQDRLGLAYLFITHNLAVVEYLAHEVAVMYLGRVVEQGAVDEVLRNPKHPYTQALLSAVPVIDPASKREVIRLGGELPSPANPPSGCHFHPRCPQAMPHCRETYPAASPFSDTHHARCFLYSGNTEGR